MEAEKEAENNSTETAEPLNSNVKEKNDSQNVTEAENTSEEKEPVKDGNNNDLKPSQDESAALKAEDQTQTSNSADSKATENNTSDDISKPKDNVSPPNNDESNITIKAKSDSSEEISTTSAINNSKSSNNEEQHSLDNKHDNDTENSDTEAEQSDNGNKSSHDSSEDKPRDTQPTKGNKSETVKGETKAEHGYDGNENSHDSSDDKSRDAQLTKAETKAEHGNDGNESSHDSSDDKLRNTQLTKSDKGETVKGETVKGETKAEHGNDGNESSHDSSEDKSRDTQPTKGDKGETVKGETKAEHCDDGNESPHDSSEDKSRDTQPTKGDKGETVKGETEPEQSDNGNHSSEDKSRDIQPIKDSSENNINHVSLDPDPEHSSTKTSSEDGSKLDSCMEDNKQSNQNTSSGISSEHAHVTSTAANGTPDDSGKNSHRRNSETGMKESDDKQNDHKEQDGIQAQKDCTIASNKDDSTFTGNSSKRADDNENNLQTSNSNEELSNVSKDSKDEPQDAYSVAVEGQGLREAVAEVEAHFTVIMKSDEDRDINFDFSEFKPAIKIVSKHDDSSIEPIVINNRDGTFLIKYLLKHVAEYAIEIKIQGIEVSGSPFTLNVLPFDIVNTAEVFGLKTETFLGTEEKFEIKLNQVGSESNFLPEVEFKRAEKNEIIRPCSIEDNQDGSFTVSYMVCEEGEYSVQVKIQGKGIRGSPFSVKAVSPAPFSTAEGRGLHQAFVGAPANITVTTRDRAGNPIYCLSCYPEVYLIHPGQDGQVVEAAKVDDNEDGSFLVSYVPTEQKSYKLEIKIKDIEIQGSPFDLEVKIQEFTPLYEFGKEGVDEGEFQKPWGIAVNSEDNIMVTDRARNNIQVFSRDGKYLKTIGEEGSGEGQLLQPTGVVCDKNDNIIVADTKNHRIQIFNKEGKFLGCFGTKGSGRGRLHTPLDLSLTSNGDIIVTDYGNQRVQIFDMQGKFRLKFCERTEGKLDHPIDCVFLEDQFYVSEEDEACIKIYNNRGRFIYSFGSLGSLNGEFDRPFGLTVDTFGRLVVADSCNDRVQLFTKEGVFAGKFGKRGTEVGCFKGPSAVEVMSDGKYVVTDSRNKRIQVFE